MYLSHSTKEIIIESYKPSCDKENYLLVNSIET